MQSYINHENVGRYRKLIAISDGDSFRDEVRHQTLLQLLAEEEAKTPEPKDLRSAYVGWDPMTELKQKFDASTVAVMRQALNEIVADRRFLMRNSVTTLEVAEHILQQAALGERNLNRLKVSAFVMLRTAA
jgi:hypothetical protein